MEGQFIIVKYDDKPYIGQIMGIHGAGELQVNCMQQLGKKKAFVWPKKTD